MVLVERRPELVLGVDDLPRAEQAAGAVPYERSCGGEGSNDPVPGGLGFESAGFEVS